ncbi:LAQU0S02e07756g1_1 [Lachancea quebecensis]|uniref:LAQU0S02e07756g1_1 n=1 Tax=Lachancea quebecensis TaxID=1654605 RepID=A0A0P1KNU1_9SACH|nr:LAQU0S02e07756g1_1 [Lachancea quebecensis]
MSKLRCPFAGCDSCIVSADEDRKVVLPAEVYEKLRLALPSSQASRSGEFSMFEDIWDFDNIGVSRQVPVEAEGAVESAQELRFTWKERPYTLGKLQKYLICADCDRGPLGIVCEIADAEGACKTVNLLSLASVVT